MLVVKIELHSAITGKVKEIGRMVIENVTSDLVHRDSRGSVGDYRVRVLRRKDRDLPKTEAGYYHQLAKELEKPTRTGKVLGYPRLSNNVWRLVLRALRSAFPEETK